MSDKFNGFSQDEINRVSGSNKQKKTTAMEPSEYKQQHTCVHVKPINVYNLK